MRPAPSQPQASAPASGPTKATPRARSVARFACVAGCSHMFTFIAGATSTGARVASSTVVTRSSARPVRQLGEHVGGGGRHHHQPRPSRRGRCGRSALPRPGRAAGAHGLARERLEHERRDEVRSPLRSGRSAPRGRRGRAPAPARGPCRPRCRRSRRPGSPPLSSVPTASREEALAAAGLAQPARRLPRRASRRGEARASAARSAPPRRRAQRLGAGRAPEHEAVLELEAQAVRPLRAARTRAPSKRGGARRGEGARARRATRGPAGSESRPQAGAPWRRASSASRAASGACVGRTMSASRQPARTASLSRANGAHAKPRLSSPATSKRPEASASVRCLKPIGRRTQRARSGAATRSTSEPVATEIATPRVHAPRAREVIHEQRQQLGLGEDVPSASTAARRSASPSVARPSRRPRPRAHAPREAREARGRRVGRAAAEARDRARRAAARRAQPRAASARSSTPAPQPWSAS